VRRKMDLARAILLELEKEKYPFTGAPHDLSMTGYTEKEVSFHVSLLSQAGFLEAAAYRLSTGEVWKPIAIKWDGFEFLDSARDDTRWQHAKSIIKDKGGALTLEALKLVLSDLIRRAVGH
jgi:hypothetical protein